VSKLLVRARWNAGLSQEALAEKVGISAETIRRIENGSRPQPATAKKLADYFEVKPTDLFDIERASDEAA
jgi:DNA-binding XRE family transcriptional regulator